MNGKFDGMFVFVTEYRPQERDVLALIQKECSWLVFVLEQYNNQGEYACKAAETTYRFNPFGNVFYPIDLLNAMWDITYCPVIKCTGRAVRAIEGERLATGAAGVQLSFFRSVAATEYAKQEDMP